MSGSWVESWRAGNDGLLIRGTRDNKPYSAPWYIDISSDGFDRAARLLAGFSDSAFYKAVGSAVKRAAKHGETIGYREAAKRYIIRSGVLKRFTGNYNSMGRDGEWRFGYRGGLIPLAYYDVRADAGKGLRARVRRGNAYVTFDRAFLSTGHSYNRVRERIGRDRYPTRQLYGPSAVQAISLEKDKVEKAVTEEFDKRIEHEILRVMNGWGV